MRFECFSPPRLKRYVNVHRHVLFCLYLISIIRKCAHNLQLPVWGQGGQGLWPRPSSNLIQENECWSSHVSSFCASRLSSLVLEGRDAQNGRDGAAAAQLPPQPSTQMVVSSSPPSSRCCWLHLEEGSRRSRSTSGRDASCCCRAASVPLQLASSVPLQQQQLRSSSGSCVAAAAAPPKQQQQATAVPLLHSVKLCSRLRLRLLNYRFR